MTKPIVGGKPLLFETPDKLARAINDYFQNTEQEEFTITGLCLAMGTSKQVFCDYGEREGYKDIVSHARLIVENSYELTLRRHGRTGDIFALKNFGWADKQVIEQTSETEFQSEYLKELQKRLNPKYFGQEHA
jgi:hypothetical protein